MSGDYLTATEPKCPKCGLALFLGESPYSTESGGSGDAYCPECGVAFDTEALENAA